MQHDYLDFDSQTDAAINTMMRQWIRYYGYTTVARALSMGVEEGEIVNRCLEQLHRAQSAGKVIDPARVVRFAVGELLRGAATKGMTWLPAALKPTMESWYGPIDEVDRPDEGETIETQLEVRQVRAQCGRQVVAAMQTLNPRTQHVICQEISGVPTARIRAQHGYTSPLSVARAKYYGLKQVRTLVKGVER